MDNSGAATVMDEREVVLTVECSEPDGPIVRHVRPVVLTLDAFRTYYEQLSKFDVVFNDYVGDDFQSFVDCFVRIDDTGRIRPVSLMWEVDDVGLLAMTGIIPGMEAKVHFTFWDQRLRGRDTLLREMCRYVMDEYEFHRLIAEVPLYARQALIYVEKVGFVKEGRMREAIRYKGEWFDVNLYSLLRRDIENG